MVLENHLMPFDARSAAIYAFRIEKVVVTNLKRPNRLTRYLLHILMPTNTLSHLDGMIA
jgi:hypothetical protein